MSKGVHVEDRDGVALVRIDRPPANALDLDLLEEGHGVLAELAADEPGAVVLIGRERFFSAGVDLKAAPELDADGQRAMVAGINRLFAGWYGLERPLVCAVNGHAIAGGLILALCGDYRVGTAEAKLGLTELRAGIPYPAVAMAVVRAELGPAVARRLVLRAELVEGQASLDLDLLDELVATDAVEERAVAVAAEMAALPRNAYPTVKAQLRGATAAALRRIVDDETDPMLAGWLSGDTASAAAGILKR